MPGKRVWAIIFLLVMVGVIMTSRWWQTQQPSPTPTPSPAVTSTAEPIVPTRTPQPVAEVATATLAPPSPPTNTPSPTLEQTAEATAVATITRNPTRMPSSFLPELARYGTTGGLGTLDAAHTLGLPFGSALSWSVEPETPAIDFDFWQMIRLDENGIRETSWSEIEQTIAAKPGSIWLVGNEPDVVWQDNVTPQRYATHYHDIYYFIKDLDPLAKVAIGGVSQPTPLRRAYLDIILDTYEETYGELMPIDIWNVHAFTLREEANSWGVDIPPGMDGELGILYELDDHANVNIIRQNLEDFRAWMIERGYDNHPLVITEYGILMPEDYGFPPELVANFLTRTFDLFESLNGPTGYAADDSRLVQWWFWFSVYDSRAEYQTGNLYDPQTKQLTNLGQAWVDYVNNN